MRTAAAAGRVQQNRGALMVTIIIALLMLLLSNQLLSPWNKTLSIPLSPEPPPSDTQVEKHQRAVFSVYPVVTTLADTIVNTTLSACTVEERQRGVLVVGNRPVGTYLCNYFPHASKIAGGCRLQCHGVAVRGEESANAPLVCTVLNKGSVDQLKTADVVVNHHGPIPTRHRPEQLTVFYSGESNQSEGKKGTWRFISQYAAVVWFQRTQRFRFTWTHRFQHDFDEIERGQRRFDPPTIDAIVVFVSRCGKGGRDTLIRRLMKAYPVHSFGKCVRTHRVDATHPECSNSDRYKEKACILKKYRFVLALDNTVEEDYVTEKVYHGLVWGPIPIYDGAPNIYDFIPTPDSIVLLKNFMVHNGGDLRRDPEAIDVAALGKKLRDVAAAGANAVELAWRSQAARWSAAFRANMAHPEPTCAVCAEALHLRCAERAVH